MPDAHHFLFATRAAIMGALLGMVWRVIATHLVSKAGLSARTARIGALTLIQGFGSALNLNPHFHRLFLDGVYTERADGALALRWVKAPTSGERTAVAQRIAQEIGRLLEGQGLLERDAQNTDLAGEALDADPMESLLAPSIP